MENMGEASWPAVPQSKLCWNCVLLLFVEIPAQTRVPGQRVTRAFQTSFSTDVHRSLINH
jgi:hypothetical protein